MAVESPQVGEETLDEMVAALRAEMGEDFDPLTLVAEERMQTVRGLEDFWARAWDQYRAEDIPLEQWRNLLAARWSRPWSVEGDYRCVRFGWQGQNAMRLALGTIECRRRILRDIEREQWRLRPDQRCGKTAAMVELFRARDIKRLRELYDVALADLDKAHALLVRLRQEVASDRRFRAKIGLTHRTTGEIVGPQTQINRFGLAVIECRRKLCADAERARRAPEQAVGEKQARSDQRPDADQQRKSGRKAHRGGGRAGSVPAMMPRAYRHMGEYELNVSHGCVYGESGRRAREGHDLVDADAVVSSRPLSSAPFGGADGEGAGRASASQGEAGDERPPVAPDGEGDVEDSPPEDDAAVGEEDPDELDYRPFAPPALSDAEQAQIIAHFRGVDEPTRVEIFNEAVKQDVLRLLEPGAEADPQDRGAEFGRLGRRIDWDDANDIILAYFLKEEFDYRGIDWRGALRPP